MKLETIQSDIKALRKAILIVQKTECYLLFVKSKILLALEESVFQLQDKEEKQRNFLNS